MGIRPLSYIITKKSLLTMSNLDSPYIFKHILDYTEYIRLKEEKEASQKIRKIINDIKKEYPPQMLYPDLFKAMSSDPDEPRVCNL